MLALLFAFLYITTAVSAVRAEDVSPAVPPPASPELFKIEFEPDAYYTSRGLYPALTETPLPHVGEQSEKDLYLTLLSRAYAPRFVVIE